MSKKDINNSQLCAMFVGGVGCLKLAPAFPFLIVPGIAAAGGSLLLYSIDVLKSKESMWENIGLKTKEDKVPLCVKKIKTDAGEQKVYHLPEGLSIEQIEAKQSEIENALKQNVKIEKADNYNVIITTFNKKLSSLYKFNKETVDKRLMKFNAGYSQEIKGESMQKIDLDTSDCHMLIVGTTGSGKSEFLRHLLTQAILQSNGDRNTLELQICDLKGGVTTKAFSRTSNCTKYTIFAEECKQMMTELHNEMMSRYVKLNECNCVDYKEYNAKNKRNKMHPVVFVIEEYSLLFADKEATELLFLLLNLSRAANISVILTIQRPDHKTLDTRIKANLRTTVCFKMKTDVDSEIVLGHGNYRASRELKTAPPGRGILNDGTHDDVVFQSLYAMTKEIEEALSKYLTNKATYSTYQDSAKDSHEEAPKKVEKDDINKIDSLI